MVRTTIDYGIDLGTTNSCIAVLNGVNTDIIENNYQAKLTPSAVWLDSRGRYHVGQKAKERLEDDKINAFSEFKQQMGSTVTWTFVNNGRAMRADELSAEVLKSLRGDVEQQKGETLNAAIITVPADFDLPENAATRRAAEMAGFQYVQLVQEPVAASLAYGFQSDSKKAFWMVYDLGGGTFDAAIIQMQDGALKVVNHGGDKHLGGKLIDRDIIDQILVPAVLQQGYALTDFGRANGRWITAFAKLKAAAEDAKIQLSRSNSASIFIDELCKDDRGNKVHFEYELTRGEIEPIIEPYVNRSIDICERVLQDKRLGAANVEKLIVVGGPTLTPLLRKRLAERLGIPLDFSIDPLTVVARGAAIFAGTQRLDVVDPQPPRGQYALDTPFKPVGDELEPEIGGRIISPGNEDLSQYTIEFVESKSLWRSGKKPLASNSSFITRLSAEKGRLNEYIIELRDGAGNRREVSPDRIHYTIGRAPDAQILTHSVGVETADGELQIFISKGTSLPKSSRQTHMTTSEVKRGDPDTRVYIPVMEGDNIKRGNRNRLIGALEINGNQVKRDIPAGTDVEIKITITGGLDVRTEAFIPNLEMIVEKVMSLEKKSPNLDELEVEIQKEKERLARVTGSYSEINEQDSELILRRIRHEQSMEQIDRAYNAAREGDPDAAHECLNHLHAVQTSIDEMEDSLAWPQMVQEAREEMERARMTAKEYGDDSSRQQLEVLEKEAEKAIAKQERELLQRKMDEITRVKNQILTTKPEFWVYLFGELEKMKDQMSDRALAGQLIAQGRKAMEDNNVEGLKTCVRQLLGLLPKEAQDIINGRTQKKG